MSEVVIPPASLQRLRVAYDNWMGLIQVVAEAMGIPKVDGIDLPKGVLIVDDDHATPTNGKVDAIPLESSP